MSATDAASYLKIHRKNLYVKVYEKWYIVTALFNDLKSCNDYLENNKEHGLIMYEGNLHICADINDTGIDLP